MTQLAEGTIDELDGEPCDEIIGITSPLDRRGFVFGMIRSGTRWFRFTVDLGVLFFEPSPGPEDDDAVSEEDGVVALFSAAGTVVVRSIRFAGGVLEISLVDGQVLVFCENPETTLLALLRLPSA